MAKSGLTLDIKSLDNSAFGNDPMTEIARILREAAEHIESGRERGVLRDSNGNPVGDWGISLPEMTDVERPQG